MKLIMLLLAMAGAVSPAMAADSQPSATGGAFVVVQDDAEKKRQQIEAEARVKAAETAHAQPASAHPAATPAPQPVAKAAPAKVKRPVDVVAGDAMEMLVGDQSVYMRTAGTKKSTIIRKLKPGTKLSVLKVENEFAFVNMSGKEGWVWAPGLIPPPLDTVAAASTAVVASAAPAPVAVPTAEPAAVNAPVAFPAQPKSSGAVANPYHSSDLEQPLPGVGAIPGAKAVFQPRIVRVGTGLNEVVNISQSMPNRIATPFIEPRVIDASIADIKTVGQSLYVIPKNKAPIGLFITGDDGGQVVSLTLNPADIPGQTVILQMDAPATGGGERDEIKSEDQAYSDQLVSLMRQVALGKIPQGYTEATLPEGVGRMGKVIVVPQRRLSGHSTDMFVYRLENADNEPIELAEQAFYRPGVRAVSLFPKLRLAKGEVTTLYVVSDKSALGGE